MTKEIKDQVQLKVAVITGANRGIGFAVAEKFINEGWWIYACVRNKSKALKRLHRVTVKNEKGYTPTAFLEDILDLEWNHAEKNKGMTVMGETIKGVTRAIVSIQNKVLYGSKEPKD